MCSYKHLTPTLALIFLTAGCSAAKSQDGPDAAGTASDTGLAPDSRMAAAETQVDQARLADTAALRDATADMRDAAADVGDAAADRAGDARDAAALRDTAGGEEGGEVGDAGDKVDSRDAADRRDSAGDTQDAAPLIDTGKPDGTADTAQIKDGAKDTTNDVRRADGKLDSPPANTCDNPIAIPMDHPHVDLALTTAGAGHRFDLPCAQGGSDVVLSFTVLQTELVYADTFGATWNTLLFLSDTCPIEPGTGAFGAGAVACNDDACNTTQSQVFALLRTGVYYLILSGANGEAGDVTLHFQHAPVGGTVAGLEAGTGSVGGITSGLGPTDVCEAPGPASTYWWVTCPDHLGGDFAASTCTGTTFDTVLSLEVPRTDLVSCVDDTDPCGTRSSMNATIPPGAGLNAVIVGGATPSAGGVYLLTYTRP